MHIIILSHQKTKKNKNGTEKRKENKTDPEINKKKKKKKTKPIMKNKKMWERRKGEEKKLVIGGQIVQLDYAIPLAIIALPRSITN